MCKISYVEGTTKLCSNIGQLQLNFTQQVNKIAYSAVTLKLLKGFERKSLDPSETKTVSFELGFDELSILNAKLTEVVEPGTFTISIGASSTPEDLKTTTLVVKD